MRSADSAPDQIRRGAFEDMSQARAQRDIDLRPDRYLKYWTRELPEDIVALVDVRRFGPGERIVYEPYTREMYDVTQRWLDAHGLLNLDEARESTFDEVVLA